MCILTGDLVDRELLVVSLLSAHDRGVGGQREVDTGVGYQVSLELSQIYVKSTVETQRSGDRGYNLTWRESVLRIGKFGKFGPKRVFKTLSKTLKKFETH